MGFSSFDHEGLNTQVLALVLSAIAYGFVVALASCCLLLLYRTTYIYSRQMLVFMYLYVIFMFGLSTTAIGQETRFTMQAVTGRTLPGLGWTGTLTALGTPIVLPFSIWGADGFMVWRCWVLYQGVAAKMRNALIALLVSLCLASLASGILLLVFVHKHADIELSIGKLTGTIPRIHDTSMALVASTAIVNAILALLIVLRLLFHQRYMIKALGDEHSSPYPKIMNICVESCALIFITSIAGIASLSAAGSNKYLIPMLLLPHVCVLSPLLIVYRVAQGRTAISPQPSDLDLPHTSDSNNIPQIRLEPIRFGPPVSILDSIPGLEDPTMSYQNTPQPKFHLPRIATGSELFRATSQQALPPTSPRSASV